MTSLSQGYSNLEFDLDQGKRGHRDRHLDEQFRRLLPCGAATAVNNNAAALYLVLSTLARGKKVLVSRGELVEIGGSFRVPSILEQSGATLKEVGTTNRTRIEDYREALDGETALILRVHPSNFWVVGFSRRPDLSELVALSRDAGIPLAQGCRQRLPLPDLPRLSEDGAHGRRDPDGGCGPGLFQWGQAPGRTSGRHRAG